jgi:hypothetical protein
MKVAVPQLIKSSYVLQNQEIYNHIHKNMLFVPTLSQMNAVL